MKKVYIVLTFTGTVLSRIIKNYTKNEYCHVSISLDENLEELYSFGRLNPMNPFIGGFVHEGIDHGTFKRFKKTVSGIYSLEVTDEQYESIKNKIYYMYDTKEDYKFNIVGLFAVAFNKRITEENSFYCADFVRYVLEEAGIKVELPEIIKPEDFLTLDNMNFVYSGRLRDYCYKEKNYVKDIMELNKLKSKSSEQI